MGTHLFFCISKYSPSLCIKSASSCPNICAPCHEHTEIFNVLDIKIYVRVHIHGLEETLLLTLP